jgi:hypothetical protein
VKARSIMVRVLAGWLVGAAVGLFVVLRGYHFPMRPLTRNVAQKLLGASEDEVVRVLGEAAVSDCMWPVAVAEQGITQEDIDNWYRETVFTEYHYANGVVYINGRHKVIAICVLTEPMMLHGVDRIGFSPLSAHGDE